MAAVSTGYPAPAGTRDWTREITPGFAYGNADSNMAGIHADSGALSGMQGSMAGQSGGMQQGADRASGLRGSTADGSGGLRGSTADRSGGLQGSTADWSGGMQGSTAGQAGGISGTGNTIPANAAASGGTGSATVRAGWYPGGGYMDIIGRDIENNLPVNEIGAPDSLEEVFRGSMKALLLRNIGNYVVATFLIGTQGTVSWEGILYDVGNDYLAIYQTGRDQYIVSDLYSLKYVEFYDTRRREMCEAALNGQTGT